MNSNHTVEEKTKKDWVHYFMISLIIFVSLCILHASVLCVVDLASHYGIEINYPIIHKYFILGILFLPLIGFAFLFVKKWYFKIIGIFLVVISLWDIYAFLKATEGAL